MNAKLKEYFSRADTPMPGSPIGLVMQSLLDMYPKITPEDAHSLVDKAFSQGERTFRKGLYKRLAAQMAITLS